MKQLPWITAVLIFSLCISGCTAAQSTVSAPDSTPVKAAVYLDDQLYYAMDQIITGGRRGVTDGILESSCDADTLPTQNGQTNFGTGFEYQYVSYGTIDVRIEDFWYRFQTADDWGITLSADNADAAGLHLTITAEQTDLSNTIQTGSAFTLEKYQEETGFWKAVSPLAEVAWTDEAYMITPDTPLEMDVSWDNIYQPLEAGRYRIGKNISCHHSHGGNDIKAYYVEFTMTE